MRRLGTTQIQISIITGLLPPPGCCDLYKREGVGGWGLGPLNIAMGAMGAAVPTKFLGIYLIGHATILFFNL